MTDTYALAERVVRALTTRDRTLATCESLTAGLIGAAITAVPGASTVYRGGLITYASDLKVALAGVAGDFVAQYGVVNEQTAAQMALGTRQRLGASHAVACTGVAGPDPQDGEPPGTVWLALASDVPGTDDVVVTRQLRLTGDRASIRHQTTDAALTLLLDHLS